MQIISGFCDFGVSCSSNEESIRETCEKLISLGYKIVALNTYIEDVPTTTEKKKKKSDGYNVIVPLPKSLDFLNDLKNKVRILQRLTIKFSENTLSSKLTQSENLKMYDMLAVIPTTQKALQFACSAPQIDIISVESETKLPFKLNRKLYNQAVSKGIYFELMYAPAIRDSTSRKNIINVSHLYHAYGKSKHVFISSGASEVMHVRSPYDIINLALIFGLSEEQAKYSITSVCRSLLLKASARNNGKSIMFIVKEKKNSDNNGTDKDDIDDILPNSKRQKL